MEANEIVAKLPSFIADNAELLGIIETLLPYIPALKKAGEDTAKIVIDNIMKNKWREVDAALVPLMTAEQRAELAAESRKIAFASAYAAWRHKKTVYEAVVKVAIGLLLTLAI